MKCPIVDADGQKMESDLRQYWSNFARTGNPNDPVGNGRSDAVLPSVKWRRFRSGNNGWLKIGSGKYGIEFEDNFKTTECTFWDDLDIYLNH